MGKFPVLNKDNETPPPNLHGAVSSQCVVSATTWQKRLNLATNRNRADTGDTRHVDTDYHFLIHKPSLIIYFIMLYLYILNYIQNLIDCVCDYVTCFL